MIPAESAIIARTPDQGRRFHNARRICRLLRHKVHIQLPPDIPLQIGIKFTEDVSHLDEMA